MLGGVNKPYRSLLLTKHHTLTKLISTDRKLDDGSIVSKLVM